MDEIVLCPICNNTLTTSRKSVSDMIYYIECPLCGEYSISHEIITFRDLKEKVKAHQWQLSGLLRESNLYQNVISIRASNLDSLINDARIPAQYDIEAKSRKLLTSIKQRTSYFGEAIDFTFMDKPIAYAKNNQEFSALIDLLMNQGYVADAGSSLGGYSLKLTASSFNLKDDIDNKQVFIATWFDDSQDPNIQAIENAVSSAGYSPLCIKYDQYNETIIAKALNEIRNSKFLIVNLTGNRPAVIFELGFIIGLERPFILICEESHRSIVSSEFYPRHYKINYFQDNEDLERMLQDIIHLTYPIS